jgi:uncharacterized protein (TIGR02391 family)
MKAIAGDVGISNSNGSDTPSPSNSRTPAERRFRSDPRTLPRTRVQLAAACWCRPSRGVGSGTLAVWWDVLEILSALDRLEGQGRAYHLSGYDLMQAVAGDRPVEDQDRIAFVRLLHMLRDGDPQLLAFEPQYYMGARQPLPDEPLYVQSLWHFELTTTGRDRTRGRVVVRGLPEPGQDDGRPIAELVLGQFAEIVAGYYSLRQMERFMYDTGLREDKFSGPDVKEDEKEPYLATLFGAMESGVPELRRKLRDFLAQFLNGELACAPDAEQHRRLTEGLARAGWYVDGDTLVIGEPQRAPFPAALAQPPSALSQLHPLIVEEAEKLWNDGHRREAIGRAAVAVLDAVREQSGLQLDDHDLMARAFRPEGPRIVVADLRTDNGQNLQRGTQFITMGAVAAIRNPVSHTLADQDEDQTRGQLAGPSFIARRLDDAQAAPPAWRGNE